MPRSINREFTDFNPRFLAAIIAHGQHQLMVDETMAARLRQLRKDLGLSLQAFGDLVGVSATSVQKWERGGEVTPAHLRELVRRLADPRITEERIRFGDRRPGAHDLSPLAADVARRWQELSSERQEWFRDLIFSMHLLERRFPAMRKGRPKGESYTNLELAFERDMRQLKLKLE